MSVTCDHAAPAANWQASFLTILPAIERHAKRAVLRCPIRDREEALQFVIASAALAYARLAQRRRLALAFPGSLVRYGLKGFLAGRLVGGSTNSLDITSTSCQRNHDCAVQTLDDWQEALAEKAGTTPADLAALRIDFAAWLRTLSQRNQQVVRLLAAGEPTGAAAKTFRMTAARVSQLRRELYESWQRFVGEPVGAVS